MRGAFRQSAEGAPGPLPKRTQRQRRVGGFAAGSCQLDKKRIRQAARNIKKYLKSLKEHQ